jgi:PAS domain S-box-containing protein
MILSIRVILHKEKMGKQFEESKISESHNSKINDSIVLSIDKNKRITKFNEECEKVFGYKKNEVINRYITDFLVPPRYFDQWENLLEYSKINKIVDNFNIPFLSKSGQEIMISWSNFPVKNEKGEIIDIGFVGSIITPIEESNETLFEYPKYESNKLNIEKLTKNEKVKVDDYLTKVFREMKSKNEELLAKNKGMGKKLKDYEDHLGEYKKQQDELKKHEMYPTRNLHTYPELFGRKKKRQEFENTVYELDKRKQDLNEIESKLFNEKNKINEKMNEFKIWREKLELLNDKLQEKWDDLVKRENLLIEQSSYSIKVDNIVETKSKEFKNNYEIFDQIQDSAVIIQRGILKQVNSSFADLVGYSVDEIVEKSFFNFIVPEGFLNIEKFYLSRLKGEDVSSYETVILTKNNNKISIEVNTKPTFFNGEKVEIAIVKILKNNYK